MSEFPTDAPRPRLCHMAKRPDFTGYGFNLHAEKSTPGQYIGKIDADSPAEIAGLKEGDRIVEVNEVNISQENHKQVVNRIKAVPGETRLLVVDKVADEYYKKANFQVKGSMSNILQLSSNIDANASTTVVEVEINGNVEKDDDKYFDQDLRSARSRCSNSSFDKGNEINSPPTYEESQEQNELPATPEPEPNGEDIVPESPGNAPDDPEDQLRYGPQSELPGGTERDEDSQVKRVTLSLDYGVNDRHEILHPPVEKPMSLTSESGSSARTTPSPVSNILIGETSRDRTDWDGLSLNMTAKEMRLKIGSKKKPDPRRDARMDIRKKFEIIQTL